MQLAEADACTGRSNQILSRLSLEVTHLGYTQIPLARTSRWPFLAAKGLTNAVLPVIRRKVKQFIKHLTLSQPQIDIKPHSLEGRRKGSSIHWLWVPSLMLRTLQTLCLISNKTCEPDAITPTSYRKKLKHKVMKLLSEELDPDQSQGPCLFLNHLQALWVWSVALASESPEVPFPIAGSRVHTSPAEQESLGYRGLHFPHISKGTLHYRSCYLCNTIMKFLIIPSKKVEKCMEKR